MIRHIVLVRFRPEITTDEKRAIYAELESLRELVPGFLGASYGPNVSPEGLHKGFADGFTMDFVDEAARDAFAGVVRVHEQRAQARHLRVGLRAAAREVAGQAQAPARAADPDRLPRHGAAGYRPVRAR